MSYEGDAATHEDLHHGRAVPVHQIYVQNRGAYDLGFKESQGFVAARGGTHDFAAGILHG